MEKTLLYMTLPYRASSHSDWAFRNTDALKAYRNINTSSHDYIWQYYIKHHLTACVFLKN